jgi:hypothetical protein
MRVQTVCVLASLAVRAALPSVAEAQNAQAVARTLKPDQRHPLDLCGLPNANIGNCNHDQLDRDPTPAGPAPARDLTGAWAGRNNSAPRQWPALTPFGQERMKRNRPSDEFSLVNANDPFDICDPLGVPRMSFAQTRGVMFAKTPDRMLVLHQYGQIWREIMTDGRALPRNVGTNGPGALPPRWLGYSVGRWEDDYTFVVETTGVDERTWLHVSGHPHSVDMHIVERYRRVDHNTLDVNITMTDPKIYTAPVVTTHHFKWIPKQELEEQICAATEAIQYYQIMAAPAGDGSGK